MKKIKGFTLIELLVVISIIALLVSILMPALGRAKEQAKYVVCKSNLHNYGLAMNMYLSDNEDRYPYSHDSLFRPAPNATSCSWHDGWFWLWRRLAGSWSLLRLSLQAPAMGQPPLSEAVNVWLSWGRIFFCA